MWILECVCVCANLVPRASLGPKSRVWSLASARFLIHVTCHVLRLSRALSLVYFVVHVLSRSLASALTCTAFYITRSRALWLVCNSFLLQ